jgi:RNA polymerase sigma factor (sigma-70 family)
VSVVEFANAKETPITEWLDRAKLGESYAQQELWDCYLQRLLSLARHRLRGIIDATVDPDDVATTAFCSFLRGIESGRFQRLQNREDLWQVLVMLTKRTAIDERRRVRALKRRCQQQACLPLDYDQAGTACCIGDGFVSDGPSPDEAVHLSEQFERRLAQLADDRLRRVALSKLSGFTNDEIARQLGCSLRSVERKLALIRRKWLEHAPPSARSPSALGRQSNLPSHEIG